MTAREAAVSNWSEMAFNGVDALAGGGADAIASEFDKRVSEAQNAIVASGPQRLNVFQYYAIRLYAIADAESLGRAVASEALEEIARRHDIATLAGGQDALQHILREAAFGRRALFALSKTDAKSAPAVIAASWLLTRSSISGPPIWRARSHTCRK
jgi:hypothetical protein